MEILSYILYIGIIYSVFSIIWGLLKIGYGLFRPQQNEVERTVIRAISYYFLASLTAINVYTPLSGEPSYDGQTTFMVIGGIVLGLYLFGKMQNQQLMAQLNNRLSNLYNDRTLKYEWILIVAALALYIASVFKPEMAEHKVNIWFFENIKSLYGAFLLKWIFNIVGFFFLLNILLQAGRAMGKLIDKITGNTSPGSQRKGNGSFQRPGFEQQRKRSEDDFDDYEIVDED